MLILRRKAGESIVIGSEIKVTVIDINEGSIRLAVDAPKRIPVLRSELLQAADANRDAARQTDGQMPQSLLSILSRNAGQPHAFGKEWPAKFEKEQPSAQPTPAEAGDTGSGDTGSGDTGSGDTGG